MFICSMQTSTLFELLCVEYLFIFSIEDDPFDNETSLIASKMHEVDVGYN